jgi:hypothetical protein
MILDDNSALLKIFLLDFDASEISVFSNTKHNACMLRCFQIADWCVWSVLLGWTQAFQCIEYVVVFRINVIQNGYVS